MTTKTSKNGTQPKEEAQANGILILRECDDEGNVTVRVQRLGDCRVTELQTVLEMALKQVREQISL